MVSKNIEDKMLELSARCFKKGDVFFYAFKCNQSNVYNLGLSDDIAEPLQALPFYFPSLHLEVVMVLPVKNCSLFIQELGSYLNRKPSTSVVCTFYTFPYKDLMDIVIKSNQMIQSAY